jgi:hypothetical protein
MAYLPERGGCQYQCECEMTRETRQGVAGGWEDDAEREERGWEYDPRRGVSR